MVCGPSGTGKTFLLEALGQQAVEAGLKVAWFTLEDLGVLLRRHRADDTVSKAIARVLRADLVVVDDIGLLPVAQDAAEGLYRLVDAAYEKRSVAVSSNLHPAAFDELMPKTLATATVDRLLHHAHVCQTTGDSVRLSQALAGQGVTTTDLTTRPAVATPGRSHGHHRAEPVTVTGQVSRPPQGRSQWPLTGDFSEFLRTWRRYGFRAGPTSLTGPPAAQRGHHGRLTQSDPSPARESGMTGCSPSGCQLYRGQAMPAGFALAAADAPPHTGRTPMRHVRTLVESAGWACSVATVSW